MILLKYKRTTLNVYIAIVFHLYCIESNFTKFFFPSSNFQATISIKNSCNHPVSVILVLVSENDWIIMKDQNEMYVNNGHLQMVQVS